MRTDTLLTEGDHDVTRWRPGCRTFRSNNQKPSNGSERTLMQRTTEPALQPLNRLVGSWATEATHPAVPGVGVQGTASIEWLEGQRFLILPSRNDHPDFPAAISLIS